ncbi:hypothetical protein T440DRAFT_260685 [Plenodomus tracheiphilus IPT5]|uniref:Uncharacterized protein n=1 Tax=Plenodomus tracheiphilus IPT5 TaxID=1408161 RepID=A0A6A7ATY2_9PLEO|nr:hypothetical protein T440DRAFT_260685 [Plenodomus tracheiphilus IPT5]
MDVPTSSSNDALTVTKPPTRRLLQLPGEVPNRIFEFALSADQGLYFVAGTQEQSSRFVAPFQPKCETCHHPSFNCCRHTPGDKEKCTSPNTPEFNQLKYVCRQLYYETARLEVQLNRIEFRSYPGTPGPAQMFSEFLASCSPINVSWFKSVTPSTIGQETDFDDVVEPAKYLRPVADFCRNNPTSLVRYVPSELPSTPVSNSSNQCTHTTNS